MRLDHLEVPGEHEARERAWVVVQAAFAEREPAPRPRRRLAPALGFAAVAAVVAAAFTPPGQAVVREVREAIGVAEAEQALFSLPAPGRLLVASDSGVWVVSEDGTKRLLGDYREAAWSPFGRFVAAAGENELVALEPDGDVRWKLSRPDVRSPAWSGTETDTRIAYISGGTVRVVAGDGTGDRALASGEAVAWLPGPGHVLAIRTGTGLMVVDADTGRELDRRPAPSATSIRGNEVLFRGERRFQGTGSFRDLAVSPDGRWLAFTWPEADQLVFVTATGPRRIEAAANLSGQFDSGTFPTLEGWSDNPSD